MKKISIILALLLILCFAVNAAGTETLADGEYTVGVTLSGGSGRASVASPAAMTVENGSATATIVWSSSYYSYMMIGDTKYLPTTTEGGSTFVIPVVFDEDMAVSAETTAMSEPHVIDYTLRFDSAAVKPASSGSSSAVVIGAAVVVVIGAAAVVITKKHKKAEA